MKKIIAFLLSMIIAYTPALVFAVDLTGQKSTTQWKIENKGINPYNSAGVGQNDFLNTSKWNVAATRDVKSNGSSYKQTVVAKVETTPKELKDTIANRAKNLGKYTKGLGKATAGGFFGSLALTGLIEGIGWVMDEGGRVRLKDDQGYVPKDKYTSEYIYAVGNETTYTHYDIHSACASQVPENFNGFTYRFDKVVFHSGTLASGVCRYVWTNPAYSYEGSNGKSFAGVRNPDYNSNAPTPEPTYNYKSDSELQTALKNALESNNPALAAAIAAAVKEAFQDSQLDRDPDTGEIYAPIPKKTKDALDQAGAADLEKVGEDNETVCVPNVGDLEGMCTSMPKHEADKIPTLKCEMHPTQSANHCVYVADPDAPPKSTIDKPQIGEDGELPDSCKWFDFLCAWTEWTQEEPDLDKDTELEVEEKEFDTSIFSKSRFGVPDQCPAPVEHTLEITGITTSFSFDLSPLCDVLSFAKPALIACSYLYAAFIVIGAARNG